MSITEPTERVFLTGGGGAGTLAAARALRRLGYHVILGDADPWATRLPFADTWVLLPPAEAPEYVDALERTLRDEAVGVFVPLVDEELPHLEKLAHLLPHLIILAPRQGFIQTVRDKWLLISVLEKHGLPAPKTVLAAGKELRWVNYPAVVKPRIGRGSRGVAVVENATALEGYLLFCGQRFGELLVQEKLTGVEYTVTTLVDREGQLIAVIPKEIIRKRGITQVAVTRRDSAIEDLCRAIQDRLRADGPFNVQLVMTTKGPVVFEINPRFSTTIALDIDAGVNGIDALIRGAKHGVGSMTFRPGTVMVRHWDHVSWAE
jgi:carbamoyl-phosphate synthase large subunit